MNENDLNSLLRRAAAIPPTAPPGALEGSIMARVRVDDGRARRWRSFVQWLLALAALAGVVMACMVGYALASRDKTHTTPPTMMLFREGLPP